METPKIHVSMRRMLFLSLAWVVLVCNALAQQTTVGQISITVDSMLNAQRKVTAHMKMDGYDGAIGIKLRGNSSLGFNQKKYTIELRDEQGGDVEAPLLGMPAHSDWVLLAPYGDVSAVRDPLAFQLWRDMGHWGPRTRLVELTLNGEYRGIYILSEAIKRGEERVNIAKMKKSDVAGRDVTGGYLLRIDTYNEDDATFTSKVPGVGEGNMSSQVIWSCIYPKKKKLTSEQFTYIQNYVDTVEQVIQSEGFADPKTGYARYIDVPSFVDYFIHTELSLNADGYKRSAYFYKEKQHEDGTGGKLVAVARTDGKEVARDEIETTDKAVALKIVEETFPIPSVQGRESWCADGMALKYLNIYAVDAKGRIVASATDEVNVNVEGAATFVAIDNGDHCTDDLFLNVTTKKMQTGYMQCILRSTRKAGKVMLTVSSPTLKGAKITLNTK